MIRKMLFGLTLCLAFACRKEDNEPTPSVGKLSHTVEFQVRQSRPYTDPVFDSVKAAVTLNIALENTSDGSTQVIWDTAFEQRSIRLYPAPNAPLVLRKEIRLQAPRNSILRLSNSIRYRDRNQLTWMAAGSETVPRDMPTVRIDIDL